VTPLAASLTEPLAVCRRAARRAHLDVDSRVSIVGAGTLGALTLLLRDQVAEVAVTTV
jgi:threonine dehydrogenase-like Zn-dependent dehydrogenase